MKQSYKPLAVAVMLALSSPVAIASVGPNQLPGDGTVATPNASASLSIVSSSGVSVGTLTVTATTAGAPVVINWGSTSSSSLINSGTPGFNIGTQASLNIADGATAPGSVLNLDSSGNPSQILGTLSAPSSVGVFVANENGIIVGSTATIDVPGALALVAGSISSTTTSFQILESAATAGAIVSIASGVNWSGTNELLVGANTVNIGSIPGTEATTYVVSGYDFTTDGSPEGTTFTNSSTAATVTLAGNLGNDASLGSSNYSYLNVTDAGSLIVSTGANVTLSPSTLANSSSGTFSALNSVGYNLTVNGSLSNPADGVLSLGTSPVITGTGTFSNYGTLSVGDPNLSIGVTNINLLGSVVAPSANGFNTVVIGSGTSAGITYVNTALTANNALTIQGGGVHVGSNSSLTAPNLTFSAGTTTVGSISVGTNGTISMPVSLLLNGGVYDAFGSGSSEGTIAATAGSGIEIDWANYFDWTSNALNLTSNTGVAFNSPNTLDDGVNDTITSPETYYTGALTVRRGGSLNFEGGSTSSPANVYVNGYVYNNNGNITFGGNNSTTQSYSSSAYNFTMDGYISNGTPFSSASNVAGPVTVNVGGELTNYGSIDVYALNVSGIYNNYGSVQTYIPVVSSSGFLLPFGDNVIPSTITAGSTVTVNSANLPVLASGAPLPATIIWDGIVIPSSLFGLLGI